MDHAEKDRRGSAKDSGADVFQQDSVPGSILALTTIATPDYVDLFVLLSPHASSTSPEDWARATLEGGGALARQLVWRLVLGLRLKRGASPTHVVGWTIGGRGDDWLRLEADSWLLTGHLVFRLEDGRVCLATFLRYDRPIARRVWALLAAKHRRVVPSLLRRAGRPPSTPRH